MSSGNPRWIYRWPETGTPEFRLGRSGDMVIAEWVDFGTLESNLAGTWSKLSAAPGQDPAAVEAILRRHVVALQRHLRGEISIHASSVSRRGVAVAFLGDGFAGKSTIAAQLCAADEAVELLSDDIAALDVATDSVRIAPTENCHWLRPDVAKTFGLEVDGRVRMNATRPARAPARLSALVALTFDDSADVPRLRRLRGAAAFPTMSRAIVRFVLDEPSIMSSELDGLARIAGQAHVYDLRRSRDLANLAATARLAAELLRSVSEDSVP